MMHRENLFLASCMTKVALMRGIGAGLSSGMPRAGIGNSLMRGAQMGAGKMFPTANRTAPKMMAAGPGGMNGGMMGRLKNLFNPRNPFTRPGGAAGQTMPVKPGGTALGAARLPQTMSMGRSNMWR